MQLHVCIVISIKLFTISIGTRLRKQCKRIER